MPAAHPSKDTGLSGDYALIFTMPAAMTVSFSRATSVIMAVIVMMIPFVRTTTRFSCISIVAGGVDILVPVVLHKIHLSTACAIISTITAPFFHMAGRYA